MTHQELNQYREIKNEIMDLSKRIEETKHGEVMSFGTVKGSSKYFPYTPQNFHVSGMDPADTDTRQKQILELLRQREVRKDELIQKLIEIEEYIDNIKNSTLRTIYRLYYIDGLSQRQIGIKLGYDQSIISRKLRNNARR